VPPDVLSRSPDTDQGKEDNKDIVIIPDNKFKIATMNMEGKINVPNLNEIKPGIMRLVHDLPTAGHPGHDETLRKTQEHYYWPHMKESIADYIKGCVICQQNKILTHHRKTPVYCIPTELNAHPFQRVAMDLIMGLPPIGNKDTILTIVDQGCSHAAIFLPCSTTITGPGIVKLYQDHVFQWFGLPNKIISDRDTQFTSHFSKALTARLGIEQNLSMAFHPQTDGLSE
jgi:Integrase zinc binding domain